MVHLLVSTRYLRRHGNGCEVSELEIFLRFDGVPTLVWPSRSSTFFFRASARKVPYSTVPIRVRSWTNIHVQMRKCYF